MVKSSSSGYRGPMIHIRLDRQTHKRLKTKAVQKDTTIQKLVEDLILRSFVKSRIKEAR